MSNQSNKKSKLAGSNISGIFGGDVNHNHSGLFADDDVSFKYNDSFKKIDKGVPCSTNDNISLNVGNSEHMTLPSQFALDNKLNMSGERIASLLCINTVNKMVPTKYEQQIILACKGHGAYDSVIDQLRSIVSLYTKTKMSAINLSDVYFWVFDVCKKYLGSEKLLTIFETKLFRSHTIMVIEDLIDILSSELLSMRCVDENNNELIELIPDYSILNHVHEDLE